MHLYAVIERNLRYTQRPQSSKVRDPLRNRDLASFVDAVQGHDRASRDMHLEVVIGRV